MSNVNVNVLKVWFGDWGENYVESDSWKYWNVWYVVKELIERGVEEGEYNKSFYEDSVGDWKEFVKDVVVNEVSGLILDVWCDSVSEFGVMCFNVDGFKKLEGKVVKVKKDEMDKWIGWEIVEDDGSFEFDGIYLNGEVSEEVKEMIVCDKDYKVFKLVEFEGY